MLYHVNPYFPFVRLVVDMSSDSVGLLSSPDRSSSPSLIDPTANDYVFSTPVGTATAMPTTASHDQFNALLSLRSPGKRPLTTEESLTTTNDTKRLCNR